MDSNASRILDGAYDCGRWPIHGQLPNSLSAMRTMNVSKLLKEYANRRQIRRSRHDVICHLVVNHAAVLPDNFFIEREADGLSHTSGDLALRENRVKNFADFLQRDEVVHSHAVSRQIDGDFRDVHCPPKRPVRLPAIFFIVPKTAP